MDRPSPEDIARWDRWFAVECNNRGWALAERAARTPQEDQEMLWAAYAAAYHWARVGGPEHVTRAYVLLAHAHALRGEGPAALACARRCLTMAQAPGHADWDIAFAHAEMALAAAASGDAALHARHYALAETLGQAIVEAEDREIFFKELARIPKPGSQAGE